MFRSYLKIDLESVFPFRFRRLFAEISVFLLRFALKFVLCWFRILLTRTFFHKTDQLAVNSSAETRPITRQTQTVFCHIHITHPILSPHPSI